MDPESENVPPEDANDDAAPEDKKPEEHENLPRLSACAVKLEGEVVLPAPRVSREALIGVLKEHNGILAALRADLGGVTTFLQEVAAQAAETRAAVSRIDAEVQQQRGDLSVLSQRTDAMEEVTAELGQKLEAIDDMQAAIASQGAHLAALQGDFDEDKATNAAFRTATEERIEAEAKRTASLEQTREQMQDRLDHMHEEIHITADQITFTRDPMEGELVEDPADLDLVLSDVVKEIRERSTAHGNILEVQRKVLRNHGDELERKAKIEVEDLTRKHDEHLSRIQRKMDADADVDLSDIRRNQETITSTLEAVQAGMLEKTDKREVDAKIEHKYEEILEHLNTALASTSEDEEDFKASTEALNKAVEELRAAKADRKEFGALRQQVKELKEKGRAAREAGGGGGGDGGGVDLEMLEDYVQRDEMEESLAEKADKSALDEADQRLTNRLNQLELALSQALEQLSNRIANLERGLQEVRSSQQQNNNRPMPVHTQVPSVQAQQQQQQPPLSQEPQPASTPPPLLSKTPVAQAPPSPQPQSSRSRPPSRPRTSESERPKTPQNGNGNANGEETRITVSMPSELERPLTGGGLGASILTNTPPMAPPPLSPSNSASVAELHGRVEVLANHVAMLFSVCPGLQQNHNHSGRPRSQGGRPVSQGRGSSPSGGNSNSAASVCLSCNQPILPNQQHPQCYPSDLPSSGGGGSGNYMPGPLPGSVVNARAAAGVSGALGGVTLGGGFHLDRPQPSGGASPVAPTAMAGAVSPAVNAGGGNYSGALPIGAGLGNAPPDNHRMRGGAATMATSSQQQQYSGYGGYPQTGPGGGTNEGGLPPLVPHAKDTMGVMGADGRLYRSDVAKGGAPPRRTKPSRDASPDGQASKFPPPR